jgi:hypothetical protein
MKPVVDFEIGFYYANLQTDSCFSILSIINFLSHPLHGTNSFSLSGESSLIFLYGLSGVQSFW